MNSSENKARDILLDNYKEKMKDVKGSETDFEDAFKMLEARERELKNEKVARQAKMARLILEKALNYDSSKDSDREVLEKLLLFKRKYPKNYRIIYMNILKDLSGSKTGDAGLLDESSKFLINIYQDMDRNLLEKEYKELTNKASAFSNDFKEYEKAYPEEAKRIRIMNYVINNKK